LKLLILGGGAVTKELYLPALQHLNWLAETTVADPAQKALDELKQLAPAMRTLKLGFEEAIALAEPDQAIVVALPNWLHARACELALQRGLHVLCEKPLALEAQVCTRLHTLAEQSQRVLMIGMVRRLTPAFKALRAAIESNRFGAVKSVRYRDGGAFAWSSDTGVFFDPRAGGVLADMGVHFLDQLQCLLGPLQAQNYRDDANGGVEAWCQYRLQASGGIPVELELSRLYSIESMLEIECEHATLKMRKHDFDKIELTHKKPQWQAELRVDAFPGTDLASGFLSCFAEQFLQFEKATQEQTTHYVTAADAAHVTSLIEWAYTTRKSTPQKNTASDTLVTGSTGFIGQALVRMWTERGDAARLLLPVRSFRTLAQIARYPASYQRADLLDAATLSALMKDKRFVVHLAVPRGGPEQAQITAEGTQKVIAAAIAAGVETVVVFSTMYTYGFPANTLVDERSPAQPFGGTYAESKLRMCQIAKRMAQEPGKTRIVILTPSFVYGPGGDVFTRMPIEYARKNMFGLMDKQQGVCNYTYVDNVVDAIEGALTAPDAHGQEFLINDGHCSWRDFLSPLFAEFDLPLNDIEPTHANADRVGLLRALKSMARAQDMREYIRQSRVFPLLRKPLSAIARRMDHQTVSIPSLRKAQTEVVPPAWLAELFTAANTRFSAEKAQRLLQWQPKVDLHEGQQRSLAWLKTTF
jgi:predicted dehydrogenase/nucleoside-diphosphate-sugar epimerase